jgi:hypothetical protein
LILAATLTIPGGLVLAAPASAHGASTVRADGDYGPYHVVVVTGSTLNPREVLMTVVLTSKAGDNADQEPRPVLGASVGATFEVRSESLAPVTFPIPPEPRLADQGYYERTLTLPSDDNWQATVAIEGPAGEASVAFPISTGLISNWGNWVQWAPLLAVIVALAFIMFPRKRSPGQDPTVPGR